MTNKETLKYKIRKMTINDYKEVFDLWNSIKGFAIREIDDSKSGINKFIKRNPTTSIVAVSNNQIIGTVLCGHDGRQAYLYHVCVRKDMRNHGIASSMILYIINKLKLLKINKISLVAFKKNKLGNEFWRTANWELKKDRNVYEYIINTKNKISYKE